MDLQAGDISPVTCDPGTAFQSFSRRAKVIAAVLLILVLRKSLLWWLALNTIAVVYVTYRAVSSRQSLYTPKTTAACKFSFLEKSKWTENVQSLHIDRARLDRPAIRPGPVVSASLDKLTDLVIAAFIDSWFIKVSSSTLFADSIRVELKHVFAELHSRLVKLDVPRIIVLRIVPIIADHYAQFSSSPVLHDASYSMESKLSTAQKFRRGKLHEGVSLVMPGSLSRNKEKIYLRKKVSRILPLLLSDKERSNQLGLVLLREILACTVLTNVFEVLAEGDFFNQMIVKTIGTNLQHREQVQRLRAALQQHTIYEANALGPETSHISNSTLLPSKPSLPMLKPPIQKELADIWITYAKTCNSQQDSYLLITQLDRIRAKLDKTSVSYNLDCAQINRIESQIPHVQFKLQASSLDSILSEPKYAAIFREFLRRTKHESEIDLWQKIEHMKAPLEDSRDAQIPLSLEFSNKDDIIQIHGEFFQNPLIDISANIRSAIEAYVSSSSSKDTDLYHNARNALFELQNELYAHMKLAHFDDFKQSDRFADLESALPGKDNDRRIMSALFPSEEMVSGPDSDPVSTVSPAVVKAVESAFEKIMESSLSEKDSKHNFLDDLHDSSPNIQSKSSKEPLFGDNEKVRDSSLFASDSAGSNRLSALFENNSDFDSDSDSVLSESVGSDSDSQNLSRSEILLAAPGDLSLAEKIDVLDNDIENLSKQSEILLSLIKKAELTNNMSELKILKRSNASLEREIGSKELQRQQYIVQENDNSLYGKSRVKIQSCVFGKDENVTYIMYIIEVQKFSSEDPNEIVAGWVVARRFSQFYKLHEHLKRKCPEVNDLKFPKKSVPYLKFQKSQQIEIRRPILEKYLQDLLNLPDVCSDPAFRSFLSSDNFGTDERLLNGRKKRDVILTRFYRGFSNTAQVNSKTPLSTRRNEEILQSMKEMERELKQFDDVEEQYHGNTPFVKPISDLLLTVFNLSKSNWLRGRALLVILHQVLGSTLERSITTIIENTIRKEETVSDVFNTLSDILFPNGQFRDSPELRTKSEQSTTRKEAYSLLKLFMDETFSKIFGFKNTAKASTTILELFQNDFLNKHLMFEILDELLAAIFPEIVDSEHNS